MSIQSSSSASRIDQLEVHLRTNRYAAAIQRRYLWLAQRFVDYLVKWTPLSRPFLARNKLKLGGVWV